jgi:hypothetical protein
MEAQGEENEEGQGDDTALQDDVGESAKLGPLTLSLPCP